MSSKTFSHQYYLEEEDMMGSFVQIVNEDPNCKTNTDVQISLQCIEEFYRYLGERIAYLRIHNLLPHES